ncbi:MAG: tetratricopeptide repeat protein [Dehalococcoidia bacterium]
MADDIVTLLGDRRPPPQMPEETRARLEAQLDAARVEAAARPDDPDALIWLGRRTAYLGNYREAIETFSEGIARWPEDPRFHRHRGHRQITLRRFDDAVANFERAAVLIADRPDETEPDGQPNPRDIPTSTLHFNVWYHLGLARYLRGELEPALVAYRECLAVSGNPDALVATSHWLSMTLRRVGRDAEAAAVLAPISTEMDVIENGAYHRLLLLYKGELSPDDLLETPANSNAALHDGTVGYGIGNWHLYNGRQEEALDWFRRIYAGPQWAAFGFIAAEAELVRL